jgi:hypothetical protein
MKKLIDHIKLWNTWRKRSLNNPFYKLLVLLNLANSPTFMALKLMGPEIIPPGFKYKEMKEADLDEI